MDGAAPCISGVLSAINRLVVRIFERVCSIGIDFAVGLLALFLERSLKLLHGVRRNPAILPAKVPENGSMNFLDGRGIGGQMPIVDDHGRQRRLGESDV